MAYEVTKRIRGHDYRYRVEGFRDPVTGRARSRWLYLGRIDGDRLVAPVRSARRVTREEIVAVTARLLESRDASRVTVAVIAHHAGISPGTFYRHFADRRSALGAALAHLCDRFLSELPSLEEPLGPRDRECERLENWFRSLHRSVLRGRAFRWLLTSSAGDRAGVDVERGRLRVDPQDVLAAYLRHLDAAELARIDDSDGLAAGLMSLHAAIVRDMALHVDADGANTACWNGVFGVIERAVFGPPEERQLQRTERRRGLAAATNLRKSETSGV